MESELSIRIAGEAGQGTQTIGNILCRTFKSAGLDIFANQDFMSRIRGGNNFFQIRLSNSTIHTLREKCDIVVALDKASVLLHREVISPNGMMVLDKDKFGTSENDTAFFNVPIYAMAQEVGGSDLLVNSVACGVITGLTRTSFEFIEKIVRSVFLKKGENSIDSNIKAVRAGYDFSLTNYKANTFHVPEMPDRQETLMDGNQAIALGAIGAGCKFYSAYPMSPSTSIMETICRYASRYSIVVEQAEDEIAAVNMVIGASFAGVRAMTSTSGGGFALMAEGVSLAGMTETPIVVVDAQRPAPATGFPTRTEQADLDFVIHAGHGEFTRAVYAPGTIEEAFAITIQAFDIAEKYQIPALILTDQYLADSIRTINTAVLTMIKPTRYVLSKEESKNIKNYKRYAYTDSGVSPRAVPSGIADPIYGDSDEHTEEGHITEDAETRVKMVQKRFLQKMSLLEGEIREPTAVNVHDADVVLVGFGSTYGVMRETAETAKDHRVGYLHLSQVWPFPVKQVVRQLNKVRKIFTVENNAGAQLAKLIRRETGIIPDGSILKYDGRPFNLDYIMERLRQEFQWQI